MFRVLRVFILLLPALGFAQPSEVKAAKQVQVVAAASVADAAIETEVEASKKLQANITLHTLDELKHLLDQAEQIANGHTEYNTSDPIAVVLHGEEIKAFMRTNYRENKGLVDLAARLDAFNVIDVKVCKRWMGANGIMISDLPPFVEPVPFGGGERVRLEEVGYAYF